jgi:hypothetical protein
MSSSRRVVCVRLTAKYRLTVALFTLIMMSGSLFVLPAQPGGVLALSDPSERPAGLRRAESPDVGPEIDPQALISTASVSAFNDTTRFGGVGTTTSTDIATDDLGNIYSTGYTTAMDFPRYPLTLGDAFSGDTDAWVVKQSRNGTVEWSRYLGGQQGDFAFGIAVHNDTGDVYVAGYTDSNRNPDMFPITVGGTPTPYQQDIASSAFDAFVAIFNSSGGLIYCTYWGGLENDRAYGIDVDRWGNCWVVGETLTTAGTFPLEGTPQNSTGDASNTIDDGFLFQLNLTGGGSEYSTYISGSDDDRVWDVAIVNDADPAAMVLAIAGMTESADVATTIGAYSSYLTDDCSWFYHTHNITNNVGSIEYGTYIGGALSYLSYETPAIAYDPVLDAAVLTGSVTGSNFPITSGSPQKSAKGGHDAYICWLDVDGGDGSNDLLCASYIGGSDDDWGYGVSINSLGEALVVGGSGSADFPLNGPSDRTFDRPVGSQWDLFIARFTRPASRGCDLNYSTLHNDATTDYAVAVATDLLTGDPVVISRSREFGGYWAAVVTSFCLPTKPHLYDVTANQNITKAEQQLRVVGQAKRGTDLEGAELDSVKLYVEYTNGSYTTIKATRLEEGHYYGANATVNTTSAARWTFAVRTKDGGLSYAQANISIGAVSEDVNATGKTADDVVEELTDFMGEYGYLLLALLVIGIAMALGLKMKGPNVIGIAICVAAAVVYVILGVPGLLEIPGAWSMLDTGLVFGFGVAAAIITGAVGKWKSVMYSIGLGFLMLLGYTAIFTGTSAWLLMTGYGLLAIGAFFSTVPGAKGYMTSLGGWITGMLVVIIPALPEMILAAQSLLGG